MASLLAPQRVMGALYKARKLLKGQGGELLTRLLKAARSALSIKGATQAELRVEEQSLTEGERGGEGFPTFKSD
jgi:hypothetical protein